MCWCTYPSAIAQGSVRYFLRVTVSKGGYSGGTVTKEQDFLAQNVEQVGNGGGHPPHALFPPLPVRRRALSRPWMPP